MFYILLLQDFIEILFFSSIFYVFCTWLKADHTKNLLLYFLAYCGITIGAWVTQLPTLTPFLFSYAPAALLLFIVLHEKTLQRNLVTLCTIVPAQPIPEEWLDVLLSSSLSLINTNKKITVIIERTNSLDYILKIPFLINTTIGKGILDILLLSNSYDEDKIVLVNANGFIKGINVVWCTKQTKTTTLHPVLLHKENALFYTLQTDALIFQANPVNRQFTLIMNGKEIVHLSAHQIKVMIKKHLTSNHHIQSKGAYYENSSTEKPLSQ